MVQLSWHRLRSDWPVWFAAGVAVYIAASAALHDVHITSVHLGEETAAPHQTATSEGSAAASSGHRSTTTAAAPASARGFSIEVQSFRVQPRSDEPGTADVDLTLLVRNRSSKEADFTPDQLHLRRTGTTSTIAPKASHPDVMTVLHGVPQVLPVTFTVPLRAATGNYDLLYGGQVIYSGRAG